VNHFKGAKLILAKAASTAATTAVTTDVIDTAGFEGVAFFGTIATQAAGNFVRVQQDAVVGMGGAADLEGTKLITSTNGDAFLVDIYRPRERFVQAVVARGTSTVLGEIYALLYGPRTEPVTHGSTVDSEYFVSPAEGTA